MDQNLNIKIEDGVKTLLIGNALTPEKPVKLILKGDINSVAEFVSKRAESNEFQQINPENCVLICNSDEMKLHLFTNPNDVYGTEVIGQSEFSEEYKSFGINETKFFNRESLVKLFRFSRRFFPNPEEHQNILTAYQSFTAQVSKNIEASSDNRGNRNLVQNKTLHTQLPDNFLLKIPIFKNGLHYSFPVEICMEESDTGVRFWFESVDLSELLQKIKDEIFDTQIATIDSKIPVIYQ